MRISDDYDVCLKPISVEYINQTFLWINDADLRKDFLMQGNVSWHDHINYFNRILTDQKEKVFAIFYAGIHVGNCGLKHIDYMNSTAELWIYIGSREVRGIGVGSKAIKLLQDVYSLQLNIMQINVHVAMDNLNARNVYLKSQFIELGIAGGVWGDQISKVIKMRWERINI
jgi:RimJ/RimL family protein N-acetyltransferase